MPNFEDLIGVFEEVRERLAGSDNYIWSSWEGPESALEEIDRALAMLRGGLLPGVSILFLPTGPIQEVAMSSGWGDEFLLLADRFDRAIATPCACFDAPSERLVEQSQIGMDPKFAEVSILRCSSCGQRWLRYFWESEATTRSGRWYLGAVSRAQTEAVSPENAKEMLEGLEWYFQGGSYFGGKTERSAGPISLCC